MTRRSGVAVAMAGIAAIGACGESPPTQEEAYARAKQIDLAGQASGACKIAPPSGRGPKCDDCRNKSCCAAYNACGRDPSCNTVSACASDCARSLDPQAPDEKQYIACVDGCYRATPAGARPYAEVSSCLDGCKASCS